MVADGWRGMATLPFVTERHARDATRVSLQTSFPAPLHILLLFFKSPEPNWQTTTNFSPDTTQLNWTVDKTNVL